MSAKVFKNNKLIVVLCCYNFIALIGLSLRSHTQSPPEQYGDSVSLGQRVVSYPVNFVTGAINNLLAQIKQLTTRK